jgi:hypothetical protein
VKKIEQISYEYKIIAYDKLAKAIDCEVIKEYDSVTDDEAGKISAIAADLIETYAGLTASTQDSGTTNILTKFVCRNTDAYERLLALADILDWQIYYRADTDLVYFEPKGYTPNVNMLYISSDEAVNCATIIPRWTTDSRELFNQITIVGALQLIGKTELFSGDGSEETFTLAYIPQSVKVSVYTGGAWVEQVGGKAGAVTGSYDYTVDKVKKQIIFETASIPASASDNVKVEYFWGIPTPVQRDEETSEANYGIKKKTVTFTDVLTVADAERRGDMLLNIYAEPFLYTTVNVKTNKIDPLGLRVGQSVYVNDSINSVTGWMTIKRIKEYYPDRPLEVDIGDRDFRSAGYTQDTNERIKRLEEQYKENQELLTVVKQFNNHMTYKRKSIQITQSFINDSLILNHPVNGLLYDSDETQILENFESLV